MRESTVIARLLPVLLCGWLGVTVPAAEAQRLKSLQVYAGFLGQKPDNLPLQLPALALSPKYDRDTTSYTVNLPNSIPGTSLVAEASLTSKIVGVEGKRADGAKLDFSSWSYKPKFGGAGAVISFDGLEVGETTIRLSDLTIRCRAARRSGITLSGHSSTGEKLSVGNRTYLKDVSAGENEGTFLSATLSGLSSGDNVIEIVVTAEDETTKSYRLVAKHSGSQ